VLDLNGIPLPRTMVTLTRAPDQPGPGAITVFTDGTGRFAFPEDSAAGDETPALAVRAPGYEQVKSSRGNGGNGERGFNIVMRPAADQAAVAPSSAWLAAVPEKPRAKLMMTCAGCHQLPSPEVRAYAGLIAGQRAADPTDARVQSWRAIARYMNLIWNQEITRGAAGTSPADTHHAYSVGDVDGIAAVLSEHFTGPMRELPRYEYGAPLAVTPRTTIREYEIPRPNAIREALLLGNPPRLWVADVSSDRIISVDAATGATRDLHVPADVDFGPHTLHPGPDRSLWVAPFVNGVVARLDMKSEQWRVWHLKYPSGAPAGIHDLSFGPDHRLLTDRKGRIWFSDIVNNAVGYFHPDTGEIRSFAAPEVAGRPRANAQLYGLAMTADRRYVWYTQHGIGAFGCFNVETQKFETVVELPLVHAGPRRITIGADDVLYVPLYGAGQLLVYDARKRVQIGVYDLPDRGSAPYAVTWDPVRKVAWIPTSNGDVIYRFNPADKSFGVIPLPRQRAFLRMIDVDPETGVLVTSYANIVEYSHGPRMALLVDPGDGAYGGRAAAQANR
jgi:streptogramin lyase